MLSIVGSGRRLLETSLKPCGSQVGVQLKFSFFTYRNRKQRRQICLRQRLHTAADILIDVKSNHAKLFQRFTIAIKEINLIGNFDSVSIHTM